MADSVTNPSDLKILNNFREGSENPELLKWPSNGDDDPCEINFKEVRESELRKVSRERRVRD
jgi:hypothetical protein